MNYLKLKNVPLSMLKKENYLSAEDKINWKALGFDVSQIKTLGIQYMDGEDLIQYVPIFNEDRLNSFLADIQADVTALGGDRLVEVVVDDRETWKAAAVASKDPDAKLTEQEKRNKKRNEIIAQAEVTFKGAVIGANEYDLDQMDKYSTASELIGHTLMWKGVDPDTSDIVRVSLTNAEVQLIKKEVLLAGQAVHVQSDTEDPTSPWPVAVTLP